MHYPNGDEVRLGDEVELWSGSFGRVVCSMDTGEYTNDYPASEWSYLKSGVLVESTDVGLIHLLKQEHQGSMRLIRRQKT
jgi:hypothetical protein